MESVKQRNDSGYARGEEVLAHLGATDVYHVTGGGLLGRACVPDWTIGEVMRVRRPGGRPTYLLRFQHDDSDCLCWVSESSIDGIC